VSPGSNPISDSLHKIFEAASVNPGSNPPPAARQLAPLARAVDAACRASGFFCITGHGCDHGGAMVRASHSKLSS
jgi:hypothetical protein